MKQLYRKLSTPLRVIACVVFVLALLGFLPERLFAPLSLGLLLLVQAVDSLLMYAETRQSWCLICGIILILFVVSIPLFSLFVLSRM